MSFGIFFEARFENDFCSISDPPDPQKTYENLVFKGFCIFCKIALDIDFGSIFASFSDPGSDENRSPEVLERDPKKNTKKYCVWKASGSILH